MKHILLALVVAMGLTYYIAYSRCDRVRSSTAEAMKPEEERPAEEPSGAPIRVEDPPAPAPAGPSEN